ncbi:hypothetical protein Syun_007379 [Stephania yunnanensis]|uniref:Uncharacterized protein n=1 Tax=Stephania yunnanensis TaxID=152371 RepID=A0AAP0KYD8_9MAGN
MQLELGLVFDYIFSNKCHLGSFATLIFLTHFSSLFHCSFFDVRCQGEEGNYLRKIGVIDNCSKEENGVTLVKPRKDMLKPCNNQVQLSICIFNRHDSGVRKIMTPRKTRKHVNGKAFSPPTLQTQLFDENANCCNLTLKSLRTAYSVAASLLHQTLSRVSLGCFTPSTPTFKNPPGTLNPYSIACIP